MPVPEARVLGGFASIEPLEQVRQIGRRDAGAMIANADAPGPRRVTDAWTVMAEPGGAYWAAFSSTCASAVAVSRGSSRTGTSGSTCTSSVCRRSVCST